MQAYMRMCLRMCNDSTVDTKMFSAFFPKRESPKPLVHLSVSVSIDLEGSWHGLSCLEAILYLLLLFFFFRMGVEFLETLLFQTLFPFSFNSIIKKEIN